MAAMEHKEVEAWLREKHDATLPAGVKRSRVALPDKKKMLFARDPEGVVRIRMTPRAASTNMQANEAAFESWALAFRVYCDVPKVRMSWTLPREPSPVEAAHYERFMYMVERFAGLCGSWFGVEDRELLRGSKTVDAAGRLVLNVGKDRVIGSPPDATPSLKGPEDLLERFIVYDVNTAARFMRMFHCDIVERQLPVGLFRNSVSRENQVFPGRKGAIDIWGTQGDRLTLVELKKLGNRSLGGVTELLFYSWIMRDLQKGVFSPPPDGQAKNEPLERIRDTSAIEAYLLAPEFHPLLEGKQFGMLRELNRALLSTGAHLAIGAARLKAGLDFEICYEAKHPES